jgi:hypothetical protein
MRHREHHHRTGIGLFFIVLGLALMAATTDILHLGSFESYFTWETVLIFIGAILLVNLNFVGGILFIAGGVWFLMQDNVLILPSYIKSLYWPGVVVLLGLSFIISSLFKRKHEIN